MKRELKTKRILFALLLLMPVFMFFSCSTKKVKIGLLMDNYVQDRWQKDKEYFVEKATEMGAKVIVEVAEGDEKKQLEQAKQMVVDGVDVLVIVAVNSEGAAPIIEFASLKNIPVIAYDRLVKNSKLDYYISFDNIKVGELQAEYLTTRKPIGSYAIISGPPEDNNSFLFKLGQMNVLQPLIEKGDIQLVYDAFASGWNAEDGAMHMKKCLEKTEGKIDAVLVANDALARGAIKVLKEAGLAGTVLVSGQDAELDACRKIIAGEQTMTVYKPIKVLAVTAAEAAVKVARGESVPNANLRVNNGKVMVPSVLLPSMVVNQKNIKMTVVEDQFLGEQDIFK